MTTHECVFAEEQEPGGRAILPPCMVCGITALDALEQLRNEARGTGTDPLGRLRDAVQAFVNSGADQPVLVDNALVVWEEVGFNESGDTTRKLSYTVPTDNFSLSGTLGLLEAAGAYVRRDILGRGGDR